MDMIFGMSKISLYSAGSIVTVLKELSKYKLDLVETAGGQMEERWQRTARRIHTFLQKRE
jgi:hypothetical protein